MITACQKKRTYKSETTTNLNGHMNNEYSSFDATCSTTRVNIDENPIARGLQLDRTGIYKNSFRQNAVVLSPLQIEQTTSLVSPIKEFISKPAQEAALVAPRPIIPSLISDLFPSSIGNSSNIALYQTSPFIRNGYQSTITSPIPFFSSPLTTPRSTPIPGVRPGSDDYSSLISSILASNGNCTISNQFLNYFNENSRSPILHAASQTASAIQSQQIGSQSPLTISHLKSKDPSPNSLTGPIFVNRTIGSSISPIVAPITSKFVIPSSVDSTGKLVDLPDSTTEDRCNKRVSPTLSGM